MANTVEVSVRGIASGGSGVAELPDGRVVFVPRTAPGDRARIVLTKEKARWAVGSLHKLLEPGPERAEPHCSLYATCGGCQLQHLTYPAQLVWKGRIVADALSRVGGLGPVDPPTVVPSPAEVGYRSRMSFTLRRLPGGRVVAGFHGLARPAHIVDLHAECVLPDPVVATAWSALREAWGTGARLLPDGGRLRLTLRRVEEGVELVIDGGSAGWSAEGLVRACPELRAVWHAPGSDGQQRPRQLFGPSEGGLGGSFEQVNTRAAESLTAHVLASVGTGSRAIDAYCGVGTFGRPLADAGWEVVGIESDETAAALAEDGAPEGFSVVRGKVESVLGGPGLGAADLLIVNPPRTGVHADAVAAMRASRPGRIVYVSCDPATLARDLRVLSDDFSLSDLRSFDLFPQTSHVETVAVLTAVDRS